MGELLERTPARFLIGNSLDVIGTLPDASVDLVMTSPPFLALRSYLPEDHPDKALEIGNEGTPGQFIDTLLDLVEALTPKLAPHGSMAIELGDTYAGSGGAGGDYNAGGLREGQTADWSQSKSKRTPKGEGNRWGPRLPNAGDGWPLDKSLCLIPELFRVALVYGFNPLTERQTPRWRARNVVRWVRPNPPVGALGDKFRPATSEMVIITKSKTRYFDLDAVRQPLAEKTLTVADGTPPSVKNSPTASHKMTRVNNPAGAPPLDWWVISPGGYPGAHYAVYPPELCVRPIEAMCPHRVCTICGEPSRRIVEANPSPHTEAGTAKAARSGERLGLGATGRRHDEKRIAETLGWTDCKCSSDGSHWRSGVVLDPFAGSGTTLQVAIGHGRSAIGIDLDERNADLARERLGMFLDVEDRRPSKEIAS